MLVKKALTVAVILLFFSVSVIPSTGINSSITGRLTIYVDDDNTQGPWDGTLEHPYQYIQDGIDNASNGDAVFVFNGTYYGKEHRIEVQVKVNKTISLIGENRNNTIIDGGSPDEKYLVVEVTADWVNISGFTIQIDGLNAGELSVQSNHSNISNNNIRGESSVIGSYNTIIGNKISGSGEDDVGIFIYSETDIVIMNNTISGYDNGIYTLECINFTISRNNISHNDNGISSDSPIGNCNISGNTFSKNNDAIRFRCPSYNNIISNNIFSDNDWGIRLYIWSVGNIISGNIYSDNDWGIQLIRCRNNIISGNTFMNSKRCGLILSQHSESNNITHNNFINNRRNADFVLLSHLNKWDGNYWDSPRVLPYPIIGCLGLFIPSWVNFDWHPASEPYDIGV